MEGALRTKVPRTMTLVHSPESEHGFFVGGRSGYELTVVGRCSTSSHCVGVERLVGVHWHRQIT